MKVINYPCKQCGKQRTYRSCDELRELCVACTKKNSSTHPEISWLYDKFRWVSIMRGKHRRLYTKLVCPKCNKSRMVARYKVFASFIRNGVVDRRCNKCIVKSRWGKANSNWKGGYISAGGYRVISISVNDLYSPTGYTGRGRGTTQILEHRYKMAKKIGRNLIFQEDVHHKNGNKQDNRLNNLVLMSKADHTRLRLLGQI